MAALLGDVLPLAVGIAISPVPIITTILMLMSPRAKETSTGFLLGWLSGIVVAVGIFSMLSDALSASGSENAGWVRGSVQVLLGLLLLALAMRQWRGRPGPQDEPTLPAWMRAIDRFGFGKAFGVAFVLAGVNPKNLLLSASAGVTIGATTDAIGTTVLAVGLFAVLAGSTVLIPVIAQALAPQRLAAPLEHLRQWLTANNNTIMVVLFVALGANVLGKGVATLF